MRAYPDTVWELKQQRLDDADSVQVAVEVVWLLIAHGPSNNYRPYINWRSGDQISDAMRW